MSIGSKSWIIKSCNFIYYDYNSNKLQHYSFPFCYLNFAWDLQAYVASVNKLLGNRKKKCSAQTLRAHVRKKWAKFHTTTLSEPISSLFVEYTLSFCPTTQISYQDSWIVLHFQGNSVFLKHSADGQYSLEMYVCNIQHLQQEQRWRTL